MLSTVLPDRIERRRMSPDPRKNPAAMENVGAAATAVAANAANNARLLTLEELYSVMYFAPVPSLTLLNAVTRPAYPVPLTVLHVLLHT